jgi:hypothetical protein
LSAGAAASWTPQTGDNGSAGDGHGGSVITDPAASGSVAPTPLVVPHS